MGSKLDCLDTVQKWYTGSVIEILGDKVRINYDGNGSRAVL